MIIYTDIITGDEICSDTWDMKEVDGAVYEVDGKMVTKVEGEENFDIGANPSADPGGDGQAEDDGGPDPTKESKQVVNTCDHFRLKKIEEPPTKKDYRDLLKTYLKNVKEKLKERGADDSTIEEFQKAAQKYSAKIMANYKNYDIYTGSSDDWEGMLVLVDFREDGLTPYLTIWKHGLVETKV